MKGYRFLSFAKNMNNNIGKSKKSKSKNLSDKYSQKLLDHTKISATDGFQTTFKRVIQKTAQATGGLIGNKNF